MVAPDVRRIEVEWLPEDLQRERERAERLEEELAEERRSREETEAERDELRRRLEEVEGRGGEDAETTAQELHQRLEEVRQSPERADEGLTTARPTSEGAQEPSQRPWWRRLFGRVAGDEEDPWLVVVLVLVGVVVLLFVVTGFLYPFIFDDP
jgi:hypothetical protein